MAAREPQRTVVTQSADASQLVSFLVLSHHRLSSLVSGISSSAAVFPPRAASRPVVIAQPATDMPPGALPPHTALQPILSTQSAVCHRLPHSHPNDHRLPSTADCRRPYSHQRQQHTKPSE
ncbi:hypothetical protein BC826DRAFT_1109621 [Russula brevipes]|nr:hypothetical protein BC826DRAFT_1109621 [Russula brevipes]